MWYVQYVQHVTVVIDSVYQGHPLLLDNGRASAHRWVLLSLSMNPLKMDAMQVCVTGSLRISECCSNVTQQSTRGASCRNQTHKRH